jgi:hypothetical protein
MIKLSTIGMLVTVLLLVSCQNPLAPPADTATPIPPTATAALPTATPIPPTATAALPTATPIPPTATAALPTATLMPTTPPPATEEEPIPSTVSQVPRITTQELKEKLDANEDVIVVDARSRTEYDSVHIPGALSIPLAEIEERHGELPQEGEIVLYCT